MPDDGHAFDPPSPAKAGKFGDPYTDVDISSLPDWWQEAIVEFEDHGLPPYRPPRFEDGTLKHEVVDKLETEFAVTIDFMGINTHPGDEWLVRIDGDPIGRIEHGRAAARFSVFGMTAEEFETWLRSKLEG